MKGIVALLAVGVLLLLMGGIMTALADFRGADFEEPHIVDAGPESVTIVLANEVLDDATINVTVASSIATDAPVPYSYTSATRQLVINGLDAANPRTLTITYKVARLDSFTDIAARFYPAFMIIGAIAIVAGAVVSAFRRE